MRTKVFFSAAFFALAFTMFHSCSEGGNSGSGNDPIETPPGGEYSEMNFQIYDEDFSQYRGNGVIRLALYNYNLSRSEYIDVGTIANGLGTLTLPASISDWYLYALVNDLPNYISVSPGDVKVADPYFYAISGSNAYCLELRSEDYSENVFYEYFSKSAKISGTDSDEYMIINYNINAGKGWNLLHMNCNRSTNSCNIGAISTKPSGVKWVMEYCGDADSHGGGSNIGPSSSSSTPSGGNSSSSSIGTGSNSSSSSAGNTTGSWCVDHYWEECTNDPDYTASVNACANWEGVLEDSCPANYDKYDINEESINCEINGVCWEQVPVSICAEYNGTPGCTPYEYIGDYCVLHEDRECIPLYYVENNGYSCVNDLEGVVMDSCPAGYDEW